jgi:hypothetical protein
MRPAWRMFQHGVDIESHYGVAHMERRKDGYVDGRFLRRFLANSDTVTSGCMNTHNKCRRRWQHSCMMRRKKHISVTERDSRRIKNAWRDGSFGRGWVDWEKGDYNIGIGIRISIGIAFIVCINITSRPRTLASFNQSIDSIFPSYSQCLQ